MEKKKLTFQNWPFHFISFFSLVTNLLMLFECVVLVVSFPVITRIVFFQSSKQKLISFLVSICLTCDNDDDMTIDMMANIGVECEKSSDCKIGNKFSYLSSCKKCCFVVTILLAILSLILTFMFIFFFDFLIKIINLAPGTTHLNDTNRNIVMMFERIVVCFQINTFFYCFSNSLN